ncbi:hypothetical protein ColLi_06386 [Colletotrichum liriopes]|uniref:Uncharacterized protein n=1 Tax=Colletotrichum liriopes TaxID=708192 RepID=A0AA37LTM7_9PEZI|nr:hypothetical protein ColLi_06386 [Colletotrichum liriopes]
MKAAEVVTNFEREAFTESRDRVEYEAQMSNGMNELKTKIEYEAQMDNKTNEFIRRQKANKGNLGINVQAQAHTLSQQQPMLSHSATMNLKSQDIVKTQQQGFQNQQHYQTSGEEDRPLNATPLDPSSLMPNDRQQVLKIAHNMAETCTEAQKNYYRNIIQTRFAQRAQEYTADGKDPVLIWFQHQAFQGLAKNAALERQLAQNMMQAANLQAKSGEFGQ